MNLSATAYERLAALPVKEWRWIANHMAWRYRSGDTSAPPREEWDIVMREVRKLRKATLWGLKARTTRERKARRQAYLRDYMKQYRRRVPAC